MRLDVIAQAKSIRAAMDVASGYLTDEQAATAVDLYFPWESGKDYVAGDMRRSDERLWRCLQNHTSQADWKPESTPALWVEIAEAGQYREIKDNMLSTEAFALGEIGWYKEKTNLYKSLIESNVYTPEGYPAGWEKVEA